MLQPSNVRRPPATSWRINQTRRRKTQTQTLLQKLKAREKRTVTLGVFLYKRNLLRCILLQALMSIAQTKANDRRNHVIDNVNQIPKPASSAGILIQCCSQVFATFDEEKKGHLSRTQLKFVLPSSFLFAL
jgi:hypothetical protein